MIVTDKNVSDALAYLADASAAAEARFNATVAENKTKAVFARLYLSFTGPVAEREARSISNAEYQEALSFEAAAGKELEFHKARSRAAEMLIEVWRSENANARAAERIR